MALPRRFHTDDSCGEFVRELIEIRCSSLRRCILVRGDSGKRFNLTLTYLLTYLKSPAQRDFSSNARRH